MLLATVLIPLLGSVAIGLGPALGEQALRRIATAIACAPVFTLARAWLAFEPDGPAFQQVVDLPWIPALGAGLRLGVDGLSLAVASMSAVVFAVVTPFPVDYRGRARSYLALMLFLEAVSLLLFVTIDLLVFYVCFDLALIAMYFMVALFGHEHRRRAAFKFVLYTLAGSLLMLLGLLSLVLAHAPLSFDMRVLIAEQPLSFAGARAGLSLLAILVGLAIKAPVVPLHTWLPTAHVQGPAPVSAILASVLLKMGAYGAIRIAWSMMREAFRDWADAIAVVATVSIVYGALVALAQRHIKRRIAYTSITHMGYTVLGIAVAVSPAAARVEARSLAMTGAGLEMVAHGLITGALFLIVGALHRRTDTFDMDALSGVATRAPRLSLFAGLAVFASLGLPGFVGFVAEFQIIAGALSAHPMLAVAALLGIVVTAALLIQLLQQVFLGEATAPVEAVRDLGPSETWALTVLLGLALVIGIVPAFVIDVLHPGALSIVTAGGAP